MCPTSSYLPCNPTMNFRFPPSTNLSKIVEAITLESHRKEIFNLRALPDKWFRFKLEKFTNFQLLKLTDIIRWGIYIREVTRAISPVWHQTDSCGIESIAYQYYFFLDNCSTFPGAQYKHNWASPSAPWLARSSSYCSQQTYLGDQTIVYKCRQVTQIAEGVESTLTWSTKWGPNSDKWIAANQSVPVVKTSST